MRPVPVVPTSWLVDLVNEYGTRPRAAANESSNPYPELKEGQPAAASELSQLQLTGLADRLWPVLAAGTTEDKARQLDELLREAQLTPSICADDGHLRWLTAHTEPWSALAAGCAVTLVDAVGDGGWRRLGCCEADDCVDAHIDRPGRPRRYCSSTCLNRSRVRAYRARQRRQAAAG